MAVNINRPSTGYGRRVASPWSFSVVAVILKKKARVDDKTGLQTTEKIESTTLSRLSFFGTQKASKDASEGAEQRALERPSRRLRGASGQAQALETGTEAVAFA